MWRRAAILTCMGRSTSSRCGSAGPPCLRSMSCMSTQRWVHALVFATVQAQRQAARTVVCGHPCSGRQDPCDVDGTGPARTPPSLQREPAPSHSSLAPRARQVGFRHSGLLRPGGALVMKVYEGAGTNEFMKARAPRRLRAIAPTCAGMRLHASPRQFCMHGRPCMEPPAHPGRAACAACAACASV